ncbi:hypothetical protein GCM10027614_04680 [Micromonospora vulcania]
MLRVKGYRGPATIVPLGVDTRAFQPLPATATGSPFTVGFVGRFEPHKGVHNLLRAAELIDCDVLLVGDGSLSDDVDQAAARRPGRVLRHRWVGHDELPALLNEMHVLAMPSVEVVQRNTVPWIGIRCANSSAGSWSRRWPVAYRSWAATSARSPRGG